MRSDIIVKTFMPITDKRKEQVGTTLFLEEIKYIRVEKGWLYCDLIREGVKSLLEQERGKDDLKRRVENLENAVYGKKKGKN
jgi:hypothetical protein